MKFIVATFLLFKSEKPMKFSKSYSLLSFQIALINSPCIEKGVSRPGMLCSAVPTEKIIKNQISTPETYKKYCKKSKGSGFSCSDGLLRLAILEIGS